MYLRRLDIKGFKSFPDKVELEFGKGITAVVGPNGSGKSNIADSIRWVLGEQSARTLRGGKMEDIIFAGTENRKALGCAEVSLTIDNSNMILPLDYSEVTVTRRLYRSGESEYLINNVQSRLKDVVELFMDTGIGKDGYSLIGQGRIEEIISSRSDERRNIFDEAAGIVKYKTRKLESERKLENTRQNLVRVTDIINELEEQIEPLGEQSKKAKEYLNLKEELKKIEINLITHNYEASKKKLDKVGADIKELTEGLNAYENKKLELNLMLQTIKQDIEHIEEEYEKTNNDRFELEKNNENKEGNIKLLNERLEHLHKEKDRLSLETVKEGNSLKNIQEEYSKIENEKSTIEEEIQKHKNIVENINKRYSEINEKCTISETKIENKKSDLIQVLRDISQYNNKINTTNVMLDNLNNRKTQLQKEKSSKVEKQILLDNDISVFNQNIREYKNQLINYTSSSNTAINKIKAIEKHIDGEKINRNRIYEKLKTSEAKYRTINDMEKEMEGFTKSVKSIIGNFKNSKQVFGTVSDLIKVPKGYEVALEIALGGAIQNIVVDGEKTAAEMINYLKKNFLGRATFLPIDTIREKTFKNEKAYEGNQGYLGIASNIVEYDLQFKGIISSILGRVVICDCLSNAQKLARKIDYSNKIVTLEGDVINAGGSFTGGSTNLKNSGIFSRKNQLETLAAEIESGKKELSAIENSISSSYNEIESIKTEFESINASIQNINIKIKTDETHVSGLEREKTGVIENINDIEIEWKQIDMQLENNNKNAAEYETLLEGSNLEHSGLEKEIETFQSESKQILSDKENILNELTKEKITLAEKNKGLEALRQNIFKVNQNKNSVIQQIDNLKNQSIEIEIKIKETEQEVDSVSKQIIELQRNIEDIKIALEKLEKSKKVILDKKEAIEASVADVDSSINSTTTSIHRFEITASKLESEVEALINKLWEEYELTIPQSIKYKNDIGSIAEAGKRVNELKNNIRELGEVNVGSIEEYKRVTERYKFLNTQKEDLLKAEQSLLGIIEEITIKMKKRFEEKFEIIRGNFNNTFRELFGGGFADLKMEDHDILNCGIDIIVQPPGKKLQSLTLLSGGEKGLAAIALIFAILEMKPTPFCVLDEIEAALDDANVNRFADFLADFSINTQFIIITHRKGSMAVADALYGVTMEEKGVSKSISLKLNDKGGQQSGMV